MKISLKSLKVCHNHWLFKSLLYFKKPAHCWKATSVLSFLDNLCCSKAVSYPLICYPLIVKIIHCPLSTAFISCFHQKYCPSFSPVVVTWAVHSSQTFCNGCHVSIHFLPYKNPPLTTKTGFYCRIEFLKILFSKQFLHPASIPFTNFFDRLLQND